LLRSGRFSGHGFSGRGWRVDVHIDFLGPATSWETIADNLCKAGWSWGCVSAVESNGRTIWIVDAHRGDGQRFVVHADEVLTAFVELERAVEPFSASSFL
jgi:hypothetical protein